MASSEKPILDVKEDQFDAPSVLNSHGPTKYRIKSIIRFTILHILFVYAIVFKLHQMKIWTLLYTIFLVHIATFASTAGSHRLWSHRAFKVKKPLKLLLLFGVALASHVTVYFWARTHRVHHKYTDTEADPHNSTRGFWFSHIGWVMMHKNPIVKQKEKEVDMSDILEDPWLTFYSRWFYPISYIMFFLPSLIPIYVWGEDVGLSILATGVIRLTWSLHNMFSINSIAHMFGSKPYNKNIRAVQSAFVALIAMGEGWHNYHHTFPWDYKSTEFGGRLDWSARLLELFAKIGWAYDLRTASPELVARTMEKYGDSSLHHNKSIKQE